jgi:type IV pilus assembly protein PilW
MRNHDMTTHPTRAPCVTHAARKASGFSLVELMVALGLGLLLTIAMGSVYLSSRSAFSSQQQLASIQQSVRVAFEYLSVDARMVGHMGCYTGLPTLSTANFNTALAASSIATNYALGIEGYEYKNASAGAYTLASNAPSDVTAATNWETNGAANAVNTIPVATIAGAGNGLTPGSDVLVIRTVSGRPVRLAANANTAANQTTFTIETTAGSAGKCSGGAIDKVSGFCANSHGLIASCTRARVFQVSSITAGVAPAASTLTLSASMGTDPQYTPAATEVFPLQTIAYYVKKSSSGSTTSLYRRIFDGDNASGLEQELIEGVENLQVRYGIDTTVPEPDGVVDKYVEAKGASAADSVADWSKVVAVRMSLLIRSTIAVGPDVSVPASGALNGVDVTFPSSGAKYDRRVFTTTVAVRNKIAYF